MRAGKLRHRLTIQAPSAATSDGMGGTTGGGMATVATVWGSVEGITARERDQARAVESDRTHTVTIRYRAGVDETCQILHESRVLRVTGVIDPDGRKRDLTITCAEIGSDQGAS